MSAFLEWLESDARGAGATRVALSFAVFFIAWQLLALLVTNTMIMAPPLAVFKSLWVETQSGAMWKHALATVGVVLLSFPVAVLLGVMIGLALASSKLMTLTASPLLTAMYSVPVVALAPLFISWLGLGLASKFVIVVLVAIFPVIVSTEVALRSTDAHLIEAARSFNARPLQIFTTVTFPFAVPFIVGGVRVAWARALVGVVVAEFFGAFAGFGFAILAAGQTFDTPVLLGYVFVLGILGLIGSVLLHALERHLAPWREELGQ